MLTLTAVYRGTEHDRLKEVIPDDRIIRTQWHSDVVSAASPVVACP